jgi:hypothetical protein
VVAEIDLVVARLAARLEEGVHRGGCLGGGQCAAQALVLVQEPVDRGGFGGVDGSLGVGDRRCGEGGDPTREAVDERTQLRGRKRAVDPSVALRELGIEVFATEDDLQGA